MSKGEWIALSVGVLAIAAELGGYAPTWATVGVAVVGFGLLTWRLLHRDHEPAVPVDLVPRVVQRDASAVIAGLAAYRHRFEDLHVEVRTLYKHDAHHTQLSKLVRETYELVLKNVTLGEAELFVDRTNLLVPKLDSSGARPSSTEERMAMLHNIDVYRRRLTELISRVRNKDTA